MSFAAAAPHAAVAASVVSIVEFISSILNLSNSFLAY